MGKFSEFFCLSWDFFIIITKAGAGKKFLPQAVRFGKRYYQRGKYNKGMYAGAGYYAGSHHYGYYH